MDLLGLALVVVALGLYVGALLGVPAGLASAGVVILAASWLIDRLHSTRKGKK
jgi:hypothetical protein